MGLGLGVGVGSGLGLGLGLANLRALHARCFRSTLVEGLGTIGGGGEVQHLARVGVGVRVGVRVRVRGGAVAHRVVTAVSKFELVDLLSGEHLVLGVGV